jgi:hypothetical protein
VREQHELGNLHHVRLHLERDVHGDPTGLHHADDADRMPGPLRVLLVDAHGHLHRHPDDVLLAHHADIVRHAARLHLELELVS